MRQRAHACRRAAARATVALALLAAPTLGAAEEAEDSSQPSRRLVLFPASDLYAPYAADPHRAHCGLAGLSFSEVDIADSGSPRMGLALGGRFGLVRLHREGQPERGWQLGLEAGFYGQFDLDHQYDNIGWDGIYGLILTRRMHPDWAVKTGLRHISSHVGDEYAERTGRRRLNYTRGEFLAAVSWEPGASWRVYAEAARAYELRTPELQRPGRAQAGFEWEARRRLWPDGPALYAAVDLSAMEERDWEVDAALEIGLVVDAGDGRWRVGAHHYAGRPPMGEFFAADERYTALGVWLDL